MKIKIILALLICACFCAKAQTPQAILGAIETLKTQVKSCEDTKDAILKNSNTALLSANIKIDSLTTKLVKLNDKASDVAELLAREQSKRKSIEEELAMYKRKYNRNRFVNRVELVSLFILTLKILVK